MDINELKELVRLLESSNLTEIEVEEEGRRIRLSKIHQNTNANVPYQFPLLLGQQGDIAYTHQALEPTAPQTSQESFQGNDKQVEDQLETIDSPMVGTFYGAPAPGEPPFVQPGDTVDPDDTVCIVEAMKIMNEVIAKIPGTIVKVLVESGEPVEYGQPLFTIRPF